ncbi:MAG TPA: hypothetical protein VF766_12720 [Pyrinomonadaceae bacterium]
MPPMGIWTIAAAVCLIVAGLFLHRRNFDAAFVLAVLGVVAWFLNYRSQIRRKTVEDKETTPDEEEASDEDDEEE